ncbi:MAG: YraN family protein [bacterium]|nr:YraN family protein [bacterium]
MTHNQNIGKFGENLAKNFLIKHGYLIMESNVKLSYQELDLVARHKGQTVFIEVKTRISQFYGPAENAMALSKLERFRKGIEMYIAKNNLDIDEIRADLITVDIDQIKQTAKIKHYKDII